MICSEKDGWYVKEAEGCLKSVCWHVEDVDQDLEEECGIRRRKELLKRGNLPSSLLQISPQIQ